MGSNGARMQAIERASGVSAGPSSEWMPRGWMSDCCRATLWPLSVLTHHRAWVSRTYNLHDTDMDMARCCLTCAVIQVHNEMSRDQVSAPEVERMQR
jgi:hypothetical protein